MTASLSLLLKAVLPLTLILVGGCNSSLDDEVITFKGLIVSENSLSTRENGQREVYTVKLSVEPKGTVTVTPESGDESVATVSAALSFDTANRESPKDVTLTTVNNDIDEDTDRSATITHAVEGGDYALVTAGDVTVTATDNDMRGVAFGSLNSDDPPTLAVYEHAGTRTYKIKLTSKPTDNVEVSFSSQNVGALTVPGTALTFTSADWNSFKNVSIMPINNDVEATGTGILTIIITHTFVGGGYNSVTAPLSVLILDDDTPASEMAARSANTLSSLGRGGGGPLLRPLIPLTLKD